MKENQEFEELMRNRLRQLNKAIHSVKSDTLRKNEFRASMMLNHQSAAHASPAVQVFQKSFQIMDDLINPIVSQQALPSQEKLDMETTYLISQQHLLATSTDLKNVKPFIISKKKRVTPMGIVSN